MPLKEQAIQQQLERAQAERSAVEGQLPEGSTPKKDPMWRKANARVQQLESRLQGHARLKNPAGGGTQEADDDSEES